MDASRRSHTDSAASGVPTSRSSATSTDKTPRRVAPSRNGNHTVAPLLGPGCTMTCSCWYARPATVESTSSTVG